MKPVKADQIFFLTAVVIAGIGIVVVLLVKIIEILGSKPTGEE